MSSSSYGDAYPLALILCDSVYFEPTGKKALIGLFSVLFAKSVPVMHPGLAIYLAFSDCQGAVPIKFRMIDVEEKRQPIFEVTMEAQMPDRHAIGEVICQVGRIVFPEFGEYRLQSFAGDSPLLERRVVLMAPPTPQEGAQQ